METECFPSIDELRNRTANLTVPLSLRIKESTKALFDVQAGEIKASTNSLITQLLDFYAEQFIANRMADREAKKMVLRNHLEIAAKKAYTLDYETLLSETSELYRFDLYHYDIFWGVKGDVRDSLIKECAMWAEGKGEPKQHFKEAPLDFFTINAMVRVIATPLGREARVDEREYPDGSPLIGCLIRIDYWIMLMAIIVAYETKLAVLFPDRPTYLSKDTFRDIVHFANTASNRKKFAKSVTKAILTAFEYSWPEAVERRRQALLASKVMAQ